jgi:hypothetical protein
MKTIIAVLLGLALAGSASAADWQTGKIIKHPGKGHFIWTLTPASELYYVGEYVCTPGGDNYAPTCYAPGEGFITEQEDYTELIFADGEVVRVEKSTRNDSIYRHLAESGTAMAPAIQTCTKGICGFSSAGKLATEGTFRYKLSKKRNGTQEVELEIPKHDYWGCRDRCKPTKEKGLFTPVQYPPAQYTVEKRKEFCALYPLAMPSLKETVA